MVLKAIDDDSVLIEDKMKHLALQLSCPEGRDGVLFGEKMEVDNASMIEESIKSLALKDRENVLELGHGNAGHLSRIYTNYADIIYRGLEVSTVMKEEAMLKNSVLLHNKDVQFQLYNGTHIPYNDNVYDKVFTVNTIYFWQNPVKLFEEIHRVLKPNGILSLVFCTKEFMKTLAFTNFGFKLYNVDEWSCFYFNAGFIEKEINYFSEDAISKDNQEVKREYVCITLQKK